MSSSSATIIPTLRYRDAKAAVAWLCDAFGFARKAVHEDDRGGVAHAELVLGNGMIMLGSVREDAFGAINVHPEETGRRSTQSPYVIVADADAHYAQAKAAGAEIVMELKTESYGGRGYSCRDLEGHLWNFGTYDPWAAATQGASGEV